MAVSFFNPIYDKIKYDSYDNIWKFLYDMFLSLMFFSITI